MKITSNSTQRTKKKMKKASHTMSNQKPLQKTKEAQESKPTEKKDKRRKLQRQKKMTLALRMSSMRRIYFTRWNLKCNFQHTLRRTTNNGLKTRFGIILIEFMKEH
jgi:hypothetical protein